MGKEYVKIACTQEMNQWISFRHKYYLKGLVMQTISFVKFKTPIQAGDYLMLREVLQKEVEITFAEGFYSVEFFNLLQQVRGGGAFL